MLRLAFVGVFLLASFASFAQQLVDYGTKISKENMLKHLSILASDSLQGRNTGEQGQKMAADYLRSQFIQQQNSSLNGDYFQHFELYQNQKSGTLMLNNEKLSFPKDFGFFNEFQQRSFHSNIRFAESLEELKKIQGDTSVSLALIVTSLKDAHIDQLQQLKAKSVFVFWKEYKQAYFTDYGSGELFLPPKAQTPVFVINVQSLSKKFRKRLAYSSHHTTNVSADLEINKEYKPILTENVIAFIEGSDPLLKNEVLVISAHYDHLGIKKGKVYNGADDNGTGTSALLELARVFQKAKNEGVQFKRSILFMCMTGEEHGLFGSEYYSENPLIPLKQTITDLNIDMIGRADPTVEKEQFLVYVIGADRLSEDLHQANARAAQTHTKLILDYKYNQEDDPLRLYYRSDHYNFAKKGIPSIFYFGGFHDDYHQPEDDVEKINLDKLQQITQLVFYTACDLLNAPNRPVVNR